MSSLNGDFNRKVRYCPKLGRKCIEREIRLKTKDSCFIGMPFRPEIRGRIGLMLARFLEKNLMKTKIADEYHVPFLIDCNICTLINESVFGIFEVTELNPNVIYEMGYFHGLGKPCFLLVDENLWKSKSADRKNYFGKEDMPIDFRNICTIYYDGYEQLERKLKTGIRQLQCEGHISLSGKVIKQLRSSGNPGVAQRNDLDCHSNPQIAKDPHVCAQILCCLFVAYHYYISKNYGKALEYAKKALELSENLNPKTNPTIFDLLHLIGDIHYSAQSFDEALSAYQKALNFARPLKIYETDKQSAVDILHQIGNIYMRKSNLEKAAETISESMKLCRQLNYDGGLASGYYSQGIIHERKVELDKAKTMFKKSLLISKKINNRPLIAMSLVEIGNVLLLQGNREDAFQRYRRGLRISTDIQDKGLMAAFHFKLGLVDLLNQKKLNAKKHINKAYKLFAEENDQIAVAAVEEILQMLGNQ